MNEGVGSLHWAARTGGTLSPADMFGQRLQAVVFQLRVLPAQTFWRLGVSKPRALRFDLDDLTPPDTAVARRALELCSMVSPDYLTNHCVRSYLWARVFAAQDDISFDDEFLYLACMLHDLGLTEEFRPRRPEIGCFALAGAEAARAVACELDWDARRRDALAEAITLHVNVRVGLDKGPEAHLLNAATALDVGGVRYWEMPPAAVERVVETWPRLEFKHHFPCEWRAEARERPRSRVGFLETWLRFSRRIEKSPFLE